MLAWIISHLKFISIGEWYSIRYHNYIKCSDNLNSKRVYSVNQTTKLFNWHWFTPGAWSPPCCPNRFHWLYPLCFVRQRSVHKGKRMSKWANHQKLNFCDVKGTPPMSSLFTTTSLTLNLNSSQLDDLDRFQMANPSLRVRSLLTNETGGWRYYQIALFPFLFVLPRF